MAVIQISVTKNSIKFVCDLCKDSILVTYDRSLEDSMEIAERLGWTIEGNPTRHICNQDCLSQEGELK